MLPPGEEKNSYCRYRATNSRRSWEINGEINVPCRNFNLGPQLQVKQKLHSLALRIYTTPQNR